MEAEAKGLTAAQPSPGKNETGLMSTFIDISDLSLSYGADGREVQALKGIDLTIAEHEFVSLIGPSGCGKTTLLKSIGAILTPTSGSITIDGALPDEMRRSKALGHVFQDALLLPWRNIADNIRFLADLAGKRVSSSELKDIAEFVGIADFLRSRPHELSGGMRQRAALCRALILDPKVLLMDEPFAALDAITREKMQLELLRIWRETRKTVVFVTHSIGEAAFLSDRVVVMSARPGRVQAEVPIDLPRPRDNLVRYSHDMSDTENLLYARLREAEGAPLDAEGAR